MQQLLAHKVIEDYWINKLQARQTVQNRLENARLEQGVISREDLSYFSKITGQKYLSEYTVFVSLYTSLVYRYFPFFEGAVLAEIEDKDARQLKPSLLVLDQVGDATFKEYLQKTKQEIQSSYQFIDVDHKSLQRKIGGNGLENFAAFGFSTAKEPLNQSLPFYLSICKNAAGDLELNLRYTELFVASSVAKHFLNTFSKWLRNIEHSLTASIKSLPIITKEEEKQLTVAFNHKKPFPTDKSIVDLFEKQVGATPNNPAVSYGNTTKTYQQLNEEVNLLANYLGDNFDIKADAVIGILLPKSEKALVAILAILKAGAAFLPIDPNYPKERIQYLIEDSGMSVLIAEQDALPYTVKCPIVNIDQVDCHNTENPNSKIHPSDLAYVIYTSGSTGKPKGVMIEHHSNVNMSLDQIDLFGITQTDKIIWFASISFDASVSEIMMALYAGACLTIPDEDTLKERNSLAAFLKETGTTVATFPPSYLDLLSEEDISGLGCIITAGEAAHADRIEKIDPKIRFFNAYGPTECAVCVSTYEVDRSKAIPGNVPIGQPIANLPTYILDENLMQVPLGVTGTIYVTGAGLARGYLGKPALTDQKFINNPFQEGTRMYDTGDLGRWLPTGQIEFLGRKDDQVKIRGFRIELEEVANNLLRGVGIQQATVLAKQFNQQQVLVAYVVAENKIQVAELKKEIAAFLPEYMVPSFFIQLEELPRTTHGKIDKKALPALDKSNMGLQAYVAPRTAVEAQLTQIWQEVLGMEKIGITDNFFDCGGHSLLVGQVINRILKQTGKTVSYKELFTNPTVEALAKKLKTRSYTPIPQIPEADGYQLSAAQNRLWVLSQLEGGSLAYNMPAIVRIKGKMDFGTFEASFSRLIERHETLRTCFKLNQEGIVLQHILPSVDFRIATVDYSARTDKKAATDQFIKEKAQEAFDLETAPLVKGFLIKLDEDDYVFYLVLHHIIGDGWSAQVMIDELVRTYNALKNKQAIQLPSLNTQYKDYAAWLNDELDKEEYQAAEKYWLQQFEGELPVLNLPSYKQRPIVQTYNGKTIHHQFSEGFLQKLKTFSKEADLTLFMTLMAGINLLMNRYTGQDDIIIGTPIAGRLHPDLEDQIGLYLNTLAIRTKIDEQARFTDVVAAQKQGLLDAYEYQNYPFDELVGKLRLKRDTSRSALFDVMVVLQNQTQLHNFEGQDGLNGLTLSEYDYQVDTSQFDISFTFVETAKLGLSIEFNTDIYDTPLIERMFEHFENLLGGLVDQPTAQIGALDYLTKEEKNQILTEFNQPVEAYKKETTMVDLFEAQAAKSPDRVAVVFEAKELTYQELNEQANQLAHYLRQHYDIQADDRIAIKLDRSEQVLIALFGILKSGAAYVPIDSNYPEARIDYIEEDSNPKVIIDQKTLTELLQAAQTYSKQNPAQVARPEHLAYIIYTSGTTGQPKGVMVEHRNVVSIYESWKAQYELDKIDIKLLQLASISFDVFVGDICRSLLNGGTMIVCGNDVKLDYQSLYALMHTHRASILEGTPGLLLPMLKYIKAEKKDIDFLKILIFGSDSFNNQDYIDLKENYGQDIKIINSYGITEATIDSTFYVDKDEDFQGTTPIGKPFSNSQIIILDSAGHLVPTGVYGEICVGGNGLARGYKNKPQQTSQKFVQNDLAQNDRMYKTGDLGRWLPDGNIEFLGRRDQQVKVRGYRIELGEIETTMLQYPEAIERVVVMARDLDQEKTLVAYYLSNAPIEKASLKAFLQTKLPEYMVPSFYIELEAIPLTPNGKIDRKALPDISEGEFIRNEYLAPRNKTEEILVSIWQEVLNVQKVGVTDNFFDLGGHSLKVTKLLFLINKNLGAKVSYNELFSNTKIEAQARLIQGQQTFQYVDIPLVMPKFDYTLSSSQRRLWILSQFENGSIAYNMPAVFQLNGVLDHEALEKAFATLIQRHESLRTNFKTNEEGEARQIIWPAKDSKFDLQYEEVEAGKEDQLETIIQQELNYHFNLETDSLLRAKLVKTGKEAHLFCFVMHHIISDGWSTEVMINELFALYDAYAKGEQNTLPALKLQYKDFAAWQQAQLNGEGYAPHKAYWLNQFEGELPVLELPASHARPKIKTYNGLAVKKTYSNSLIDNLSKLGQAQGSTLYMGMLAAINVLLHKYSRQGDITIGSAIAGREHIDLQDQIGFYVNTLALRTQFEGKNTFKELLDKVKQVTLDAFEHQAYPFDELVENLPLNRDMSRNPLFDVMLTFQDTDNLKVNVEKPGNLSLTPYPSREDKVSKFDLDFIFEKTDAGLELVLTFNADIYSKEFARNLADHLEVLVQNIVAEPEQAISTLEYLNEAEKQQLLLDFNNTQEAYAREATFIDIFKQQVEKMPQKTAIKDDNSSYTYAALDQLSDQIAAKLVDRYGTDKFPIAVLLNRSAMMVATLIGIIKTGKSYIPLDPSFPKDRLAYILENSGAGLMIADEKYSVQGEEDIATTSIEEITAAVLPSTELSQYLPSADDTAYIIYTSGSTGKPKGVEIGHQSLLNFLTSMGQKPGIGSADTLFSVTTYSFDISILEFFAPLIAGATLYVANQKVLAEPSLVMQKIKEIQPTVIQATPSFYQMLYNAEWEGNKALKVLCGGDSLNELLAKDILGSCKELWNMYGPTETTIWSSIKQIKQASDASSIGKPINNTSFYILDDSKALMPVGAIGAIYIGGEGLAKGYYKNDTLTKERFTDNPFGSGRIYETGDVGRWNEQGEIEFLGRNDNQVKIRGYRIELGELENTILQYSDALKEAVVITRGKADDKALHAYFVADKKIEKAELRTFLEQQLPHYMVPNYYAQLAKMPLSPNGKTDRKSLPRISGENLQQTAYVAPRTDLEKNLVKLWEDVLGVDKVGINDVFFDLGGNSLKAVLIVNKIKHLYADLYIENFIEAKTIQNLANLISLQIENEVDDESYEEIVI